MKQIPEPEGSRKGGSGAHWTDEHPHERRTAHIAFTGQAMHASSHVRGASAGHARLRDPIPLEGPRLPMKSRRGGFLSAWLPVFAYIAVIFILSSQPGLKPPFRWANGDKLAHTLEYGGLGFLLVRALRSGPTAMGPVAGGVLALVIGMTVGATDETYQRFVPGRESSVLDWFADTGGLILAQLAWLALKRE